VYRFIVESLMKLTQFGIWSISWQQRIKQVSSEKEAVRNAQLNIYAKSVSLSIALDRAFNGGALNYLLAG